MSYTYLEPAEAVPLLLDRSRSPVVALDTEFEEGKPPCQADLYGVSLAGGTPETGLVGTYWHFGGDGDTWPWEMLRDKVLLPLHRDPLRTLAMHPPKVDVQPLRARGVGRSGDCAATIRCTMSQAHVFDENLPKGLKDLAYALLGVTGVASYKAVRAEQKAILKEGENLVKALLTQSWEVYRDERRVRRKKDPIPEVIEDAAWPSWHKLVMRLPARGVKKADVEEYMRARIEHVVMDDYRLRARQRFALYGTEDALYTLGLDYFFQRGMTPAQRKMAAWESQVCHPVVTEMEEAGLLVDLPRLAVITQRMEEAAAELRVRVLEQWQPYYKQAGGEGEFNPGSHDQIAVIIWDVMKLRPPPWAQQGGRLKPKWMRSKDGLCKTSAKVLDWLVGPKGATNSSHRAQLKLLMDLHNLEDMLSDRSRPLLSLVQSDPLHRVHSSFWPVKPRTGRFASSDPNVENIPRPGSMPYIWVPQSANYQEVPSGLVVAKLPGGKIDTTRWQVGSLRDCFIPADGWLLVSADESQVENRIVAHESQDPTLLKVFRVWDCFECKQTGETDQPLHRCPVCGAADGKRDKTQANQPAIRGFCLGKDIHAHTSASLGWHETKGYDKGRQAAKAVNHATAYGMGATTMSQTYNMPHAECQEALDAWHARHPNVKAVLHHSVEESIRRYGYVTYFDGEHVRRFDSFKLMMDAGILENWEWLKIVREGVNAKAQGGTALIIKEAMIKIREELRETYPRVRGVNQVHDEVLYEAPEDEAEDVLKIVVRHLEDNRMTRMLSVPILADGAIGRTWGEAH